MTTTRLIPIAIFALSCALWRTCGLDTCNAFAAEPQVGSKAAAAEAAEAKLGLESLTQKPLVASI